MARLKPLAAPTPTWDGIRWGTPHPPRFDLATEVVGDIATLRGVVGAGQIDVLDDPLSQGRLVKLKCRWAATAVVAAAAPLFFAAFTHYHRRSERGMRTVTSAPVGIVAFSFGTRCPDSGPSPTNLQLAEAVDRLRSSWFAPVTVAAQFEVADHLRVVEGHDTLVIRPIGEDYFDSRDLWEQAQGYFRGAGINSVIAVAQPFLHLRYVRRLIRHDGFRVIRLPIRGIGFDRSTENMQWWTRGRIRLISYAISRRMLHHTNK